MFLKNKVEVDTDPQKIEEFLTRSVSSIYPTKEELKKELLSGKRLRVYVGADATGSQLHLGHSTNFILLEKLRRMGHEIIVLFGDFTAMIGDPTGKDSSRVMLDKKQVNKNLKTWEKQISKIINLNDRSNPVKIVKNSKWLSKLNFNDVVDLSSNFTVGQMIERDMFQKRISEDKPIYLHEFFYPLMQGYDSVALDVDLEIGGNDQTFNMLAGRTLLKKIKNKEKFVLSTTLLVNPVTGKKLMNKSGGSFIALNDSPDEMFGKILALPDEVIIPMFVDTTFVEMEEINKIKSKIEKKELNPKDAKVRLAKEVVTIYHSKKDADRAEENFEKTFKKGDVPENVLEAVSEPQKLLSEILVENKIIESKNEWRRLVDQKGISVVEDGNKIEDLNYKVTETKTYRVGKKRFIKVVV